MGAAQIVANSAGAEDSQTPVRNSDYIAVESRRDLASRHGSIVRIASVNLMQRQRARYCYPLYTFGGALRTWISVGATLLRNFHQTVELNVGNARTHGVKQV